MSNYPLNLPESLKQEAQRRAKLDGVSLNQWIAAAVAEKIGAVNAAEYFRERGAGGTSKRLLGFLRAAPDRIPDPGDEGPSQRPRAKRAPGGAALKPRRGR